jgi:hypothetical protein
LKETEVAGEGVADDKAQVLRRRERNRIWSIDGGFKLW